MTGALLGSGRAADVFADAPGWVLRRYRTEHDSGPEAALMRYLHDAGYPVPKVARAEGREIVMERIDGRTMLADLSAHPWRLRRHARVLADLHTHLARIPAPDVLSERFVADTAGDDARADGVLHLDLHPDNVMLGPCGPVVIDWSNARRGNPADEAANTWLLMATGDLPSGGIQRLVATAGRRAFTASFLSRFDRPGLVVRIPAVAERRLADPIVGEAEADRVRRFLATVTAP